MTYLVKRIFDADAIAGNADAVTVPAIAEPIAAISARHRLRYRYATIIVCTALLAGCSVK